jgi:hypothetical protein
MASTKNPARGNELPHAKLTAEIVADIRKRAPTTAHRVLAAEYGVHVNSIGRVVTYQTWWHK